MKGRKPVTTKKNKGPHSLNGYFVYHLAVGDQPKLLAQATEIKTLWHISSLEQMRGLVSWGEALESVKEQSVVAVIYLMENTSGLSPP